MPLHVFAKNANHPRPPSVPASENKRCFTRLSRLAGKGVMDDPSFTQSWRLLEHWSARMASSAGRTHWPGRTPSLVVMGATCLAIELDALRGLLVVERLRELWVEQTSCPMKLRSS